MRLVAVYLVISAAVAASLALLEPLAAQQQRPAEPAPCTCSTPEKGPTPPARPRFADHSQDLDDSDEIAALEAIRIALTEVGDGSSYVWHRGNGRLSGVIHPTVSFKDQSGRVCRHIVVVLTTGFRTGRAEGVACRLEDGQWQLEG
jgi:17 kDa outer membrane surface antigen